MKSQGCCSYEGRHVLAFILANDVFFPCDFEMSSFVGGTWMHLVHSQSGTKGRKEQY